MFNDVAIASSERALRVLETAGPPTYYVPPDDLRRDHLVSVEHASSLCEWKGRASYHDISVGERCARRAAWSYPHPNPPYTPLAGYLAFYPGRVDACFLDDERVRPQPGHFYGGWITDDIVGPFKGEPGSEGW